MMTGSGGVKIDGPIPMGIGFMQQWYSFCMELCSEAVL